MMATEYLRDDAGRPIFIQGYAAVYDSSRVDGHPRKIRRGAFDAVLKHPRAGFNLQFHHAGPSFMVGCLALDTLWVWSDNFGLGFQAGPYTACGRNGFLLRSIADGTMRGASWSGVLGKGQTQVIRSVKTLDHIAVVDVGAYPEAGVWLSSEYHYDLPPRLRALSELWAARRPTYDTARALRHLARVTARLPRRAATPRSAMSRPSQVRAVAKRRAPVPAPLAVHEIYPAFGGFSSIEIAKMVYQDRKAWRKFQSNYPGISRAQARCMT